MKVLLSGISSKNGYMIIDVFYSVLSAMNYPIMSHDASSLRFIDIDDNFKITTLRYDFHGKKILMG